MQLPANEISLELVHFAYLFILFYLFLPFVYLFCLLFKPQFRLFLGSSKISFPKNVWVEVAMVLFLIANID